MSRRIVEVADAIVMQMNGATWSETFEAVRLYTPSFTPTAMETLRVTVMTLGEEVGLSTRIHRRRLMMIDIGIQKKIVDVSSDDEADTLSELAEEITDYWAVGTDGGSRRLTGAGFETVKVLGAMNNPLYSVEDLKERGNFFSHITVTLEEHTRV